MGFVGISNGGRYVQSIFEKEANYLILYMQGKKSYSWISSEKNTRSIARELESAYPSSLDLIRSDLALGFTLPSIQSMGYQDTLEEKKHIQNPINNPPKQQNTPFFLDFFSFC